MGPSPHSPLILPDLAWLCLVPGQVVLRFGGCFFVTPWCIHWFFFNYSLECFFMGWVRRKEELHNPNSFYKGRWFAIPLRQVSV